MCTRHNSEEVPGLVVIINVSPLLGFCLAMGDVAAGRRGLSWGHHLAWGPRCPAPACRDGEHW